MGEIRTVFAFFKTNSAKESECSCKPLKTGHS